MKELTRDYPCGKLRVPLAPCLSNSLNRVPFVDPSLYFVSISFSFFCSIT